MQKWIALSLVKLMLMPVTVFASAPYFKAGAGLAGGAISGTQTGVRIGTELDLWDLSFGYDRIDGAIDSDKVQSNGATLHAMGLEAYKIISLDPKASVRIGGGFGYGIPELAGRDKAEPEVYGSAGLEARYLFTEKLRLEFSARGFFMKTHTHRTDYSSHVETLSTGQDVEVLDQTENANSLGLNSGVLGVAFVYRY